MRDVFTVVLVAWSLRTSAQRPEVLPVLASHPVAVAEPSDLAWMPGSADRLFVVSDNGFVAVVDTLGRQLRRSPLLAFDLEACALHDRWWVVVDEGARHLRWLDTVDLRPQRTLTVPYAGGRNKGVESIVWLPDRQRWLLVTERDPVLAFELDADGRVVNETALEPGVRDIASATWADGTLWLLSDMDRQVMRCTPGTFTVDRRYTIPVINPEGFVIGPGGRLWVVSDDRQRLYRFQLPAAP